MASSASPSSVGDETLPHGHSGVEQIQTKNNTGFDMGKPSYHADTWWKAYDPVHPELPIVDIGSGLGSNVLAALKTGARVIAIDMSDEHLEEIRSKAAKEHNGAQGANEGDKMAERLETRWGQLPDKVPLEAESVSGIMCAQVLHFLNPDDVVTSFRNFAHWLAPGGVLVVLVCSHYQKLCYGIPGKVAAIDAATEKDPEGFHGFTPAGKSSQEMFDAMLESVPAEVRAAVPGRSQQFQTFAPPQLRAVAIKCGLEVDLVEFADGRLSNYPVFLYGEKEEERGREQVVLVARKPRM